MKIRSVELTNFRKFVGTVCVDTIGDNVNVLVGRNELGKSTLLQAINGVIFEKARSTASHVKAFRHFVNGTVPEVKLAFDVEGKSCGAFFDKMSAAEHSSSISSFELGQVRMITYATADEAQHALARQQRVQEAPGVLHQIRQWLDVAA